MSGLAEKLWFVNLPPTKSGDDAEHQVLNTATSGSAADYDWVAALGASAPKGKCFIAIEAVTQDLYVRLGPSATTATTTSTGLLIKAGQPPVKFYVNPAKHNHIDHIAAGAGVMKVQVCSPIGERLDQ